MRDPQDAITLLSSLGSHQFNLLKVMNMTWAASALLSAWDIEAREREAGKFVKTETGLGGPLPVHSTNPQVR